MLSGFPALSAQSLLSGDFMDGIESYLSDAFFCRSGAAAFSDSLTGLFSVPDDSPDTGAIDEALLGDEPAAEAGQEETQSAALTEEAAAVETPAALRAVTAKPGGVRTSRTHVSSRSPTAKSSLFSIAAQVSCISA